VAIQDTIARIPNNFACCGLMKYMVRVNQVLDHYEVIEKLGEGGMGVVYKARDMRLGRLVAIKVLPPAALADQNLVRRLQFEARAASNLNHPNIVVIHDIAAADGVNYLVMEYVNGKTLNHVIPPKGMKISDALKIAIQIADGLSAAATAGIIHRDLKPGNIMITDSGQVKILDFGLAKNFGLGNGDHSTIVMGEQTQTEPGLIVGTVAYMSPEQVESKSLDPRSDIFSFGSVLYEMVTGRRAFGGQTMASTISSILRDVPTPVSQLAGEIPDELDAVIGRCLRKDPARRFQTIADVKVCLLDLVEDAGQERRKTRSLGRRGALPIRKLLLYLGACVVIAVLVWAARSYFQAASQPPRQEVRVTPFASYGGYMAHPAFSRDSNELAFEWTGGAGMTSHIYVKVIGTDFPLQITSGQWPDGFPVFAPDDRSIAFLRVLQQGKTGIYQVSPLGGRVRLIAEIPTSLYQQLVWSSDGKWLLTSARAEGQESSRLLAVSTSDGQSHYLTFGKTSDEFNPTLSPDSSKVAFVRRAGYADWELFVVRVTKDMQPLGTPVRVNAPSGLNKQPVWTADGKDLVFVNGTTAATRLWRINADNKTSAQQMTFAGEPVDDPAIASNGQRLAFARDFDNTNIWRISLDKNGAAGESAPIASSSRSSFVRPHAFSSDGTRIAFESNRAGYPGIWTANADGSGATLLYGKEGTHAGSPTWSADDRWIAFDTRVVKHSEVFVISAEGGSPRAVTNGEFDDLLPAWSTDGKWIYFDSNRTGRFEIFRCNPSGSEIQQITHGGAWGVQESRDGKFLYYTRSRELKSPLLRMPVEGGPETTVLPDVRERWWAPAEHGVWYMDRQGDETDPGLWSMMTPVFAQGTLRFFDVQTKRAGKANVIPRTPVGGIALSPDERTILAGELDHQGREIAIAENFQ
jgi:eukaryotic-like serine/threonine-protein kinase